MSWFDKLFRRKKTEPTPPAEQGDASMIRVYDSYGREMLVSKENWQKSILPAAIKDNWNNPDKLYGVVAGSLEDGLFAEVLDAARHLCEIDRMSVRATLVYGIVLMKTGQLDEAERVLRTYNETQGEDGYIMTNLAKVHAERGDMSEAERVLWRALEIDPNQDNGLQWYLAIQRERGGEIAERAALQRAASLPQAWLPQIWLARSSLQKHNLRGAMEQYRICLDRVARPVPTNVLKQMSGDLGNAGHLLELLELVEPQFIAPLHGLEVGNNLIKAHVDLGQLKAAHQILDQLYALRRPDYTRTLSYWDAEIAKARVARSSIDRATPLNAAILVVEGPVWLPMASPAAELFPTKTQDSVGIAFLGFSAELERDSPRIEHQLATAPGRMSRALPLFLAEQIHFHTRARVHTLVPFIVEPKGGFVLSGVRWRDEYAVKHSNAAQIKSDYVVISHVRAQSELWTIELRLIRCDDGKSIGDLSASTQPDHEGASVLKLARELLTLFTQQTGLEAPMAPGNYRVPGLESFSDYLLRLEQLLAVRCEESQKPGFLNGEREIIDGDLRLCLAWPDNLVTRVLLAQTLRSMKRTRPEVVSEFRDKILTLQREKPLAEPAQTILQGWIEEVVSS
jgi:tetratricopeptide (TPR) repeat protein